MTTFITVSDNGGRMFNRRRQTSDKSVISDVEKIVGDGYLYVSMYSAPLFDESNISVIASSAPYESSAVGDFVFAEDVSDVPKDRLSTLVIYRWNRSYPADTYLTFDPKNEGFTLISSLDFEGSSHKKITREIWKRT